VASITKLITLTNRPFSTKSIAKKPHVILNLSLSSETLCLFYHFLLLVLPSKVIFRYIYQQKWHFNTSKKRYFWYLFLEVISSWKWFLNITLNVLIFPYTNWYLYNLFHVIILNCNVNQNATNYYSLPKITNFFLMLDPYILRKELKKSDDSLVNENYNLF